ncbi:MarR family winged helix-turn-helix transcriptional regulator [Alicyclobacillus mengziensis]|uniref:MarR family transcriptional regulator n=1 Tax=Alicyclobacillus mengziensis TaxID=2931921 RepID=A0A9X7VVP1_9BACL|nr:MarR family transcriptional regulator [Alicyclobacillus mengziensis]QSO45943.1 MarR family transcriptional regulator [Alicyclobacillus mengziensis]
MPEHVVEIEQQLRQIAGVVRRRGRLLLEQFGITPPQFDALIILDRSGDLTIGELSSRLYLAYSTTTDLVDRLERAGFVVRSRDTADRRVVLVKLQETGHLVIEKVMDARRAYLGGVLESLDESERLQILRVLNLLHERMHGSD